MPVILRILAASVACVVLLNACISSSTVPSGSRRDASLLPTSRARNPAIMRVQARFARKRIEFSEAQRDTTGAPSRGLRARGILGGTYWFTPEAQMTRLDDFVIVRDYGAIFLFKASDLEVRDNVSNAEVRLADLPIERSETAVATTIHSGHIAHRAGRAICPECYGVQRPSRSAKQGRRAPEIFTLPQLCDSDTIASCDGCANLFSMSPCCDLASEDCSDYPTGDGSSGYYDQYGNLVTGQCAAYAFDADLYALCQAFGIDSFQLTLFRGAGVRSFKWYTVGASRLEVNNPYNGANGTPTFGYYNFHVYDLIAGQADLYFQPMDPLSWGLQVWCFDTHTAPTPFESETVDVVPVGFPTKYFTARLARVVTGSLPDNRCP